LLSGDVFRQSGRRDVHQPVEDRVARNTGDLAVSIEVRLGDFISTEFQYQVGTADIPGGITAAGIGPIVMAEGPTPGPGTKPQDIAAVGESANRGPLAGTTGIWAARSVRYLVVDENF
jgi:hypothetical protein